MSELEIGIMSEASAAAPAKDKTAYLMVGHGLESSPHNDRVPPGCTLVVKASACEPTYTKFIDFVKDDNQEKFIDPVGNADHIMERYGPVAIYKEGDVYPNIKYKLIGYHNMDDMDPSSIMMLSSGVIQYPFNKRPGKFVNYKAIKKNLTAYAWLPLFYENSIYPTSNEVRAKIVDLGKTLQINPYNITFSEFLEMANKYKIFTISQKELFDFVREDKFAPGAFYNFSCRSLSSNLKSKMIGRNTITGRKMILPKHRLNLFKTEDNAARLAHIQELNESRARQSLRGSLLEPLLRNKLSKAYTSKKNTNTRSVLKQQIEEAELHRKPYIKMHYEKKTRENNANGKKEGGRRKTRKVKK